MYLYGHANELKFREKLNMSQLFSCYLLKFWVTSFVLLISALGLFSQDIKSVWFTESGQMVCKMCPGRPNYQLNYMGTNCNKSEAVAVLNGSYNVQYVKLLNRTINNSNQVQQVVAIDSGYHIINAVKFKKKGSSQTFVYNLNSKETPPVFVGYHCYAEPTLFQRKVSFSQNGINVCSLCVEGGLYQMNVEGDDVFIAANFSIVNEHSKKELLIESVGPKRFINSNKYQQDVRAIKGGLGIIYTVHFFKTLSTGTSYDDAISMGYGLSPIFVGYHCY